MKSVRVTGHTAEDGHFEVRMLSEHGAPIEEDPHNTVLNVLRHRQLADAIDKAVKENNTFEYILPMTL